MAAAASGKPLPDAARNVLEKHARLIDCQSDLAKVHSELAKAQLSELRLRHIGEGVRAALWAALAVAAFLVVSLIVSIVVRAARADALIIERFRVPPSLEAKGLHGEVVATQVLDRLAEMQERTQSVRAASTYANNWDDELKIEIPNTGASTSEIWKLLRGWLGKETRISGEVVEAERGLALTARVGATSAQRFVNDSADLDALVIQAAELIYRRTQPYRFAIYAGKQGREEERNAVLMQLTRDPSPVERKWAYSGLSVSLNGLGRFRESLVMAKRALAIDSSMAPALANGARALAALGHDQEAFDWYSRAKSHRIGKREYDALVAASNQCRLDEELAWFSRDPALSDRSAGCTDAAVKGERAQASSARFRAAFLRRDPEAANRFWRRALEGLNPKAANYQSLFLPLVIEYLHGPSPRLAEALEASNAVQPDDPYFRATIPTEISPFQADALSLLGRHAEASALIERTPLDCYNCVRVRGVIAERQGDGRSAHRWYAEAVRQGPRLPAAYADWGRLLARHGRYEAAELRLRKAAELAPNWADPFKYWGDALAAQGRRSEALARYDAALKLAPNWRELKEARERIATAA